MSNFVILIILGLIGASLAAPVQTIRKFNEVCGAKTGVSEAIWTGFNLLLDDWTEAKKCYVMCTMEVEGNMVDGRISDAFKTSAQTILDDDSHDEMTKAAANLVMTCTEEAEPFERCEAAYKFTQCVTSGTMAILLAKVVEGLAEAS